MKIKNTVTTLLKVIGLIALLFAINAYRKALLLFNPKVLISVYFCFGLLCGFVFHHKDFRKISGTSLIAGLTAGLIFLFLLSLTGRQFNAFHFILISDVSMTAAGWGFAEILFSGE